MLVDNRYRIVRLLGGGGMGEVHLAHDEVLGRDVALKLLDRQLARDEEFVERFRREARSAASLSHPHIVPVYDWGPSGDGTYYIAMEYLPGGTLKDLIRREGALPPATAVGIALQIAEALRAAHGKGVVHRDVKPQNVLSTESGQVKLTDFGIARAANLATMTRTGLIMGTAHYISPEQAMGEPVGPRSDLYSLGVVLYEMLTGNVPYDAETPIGIAMKHVNGRLEPPRMVNPEVPERLNALIMKLLNKPPGERPQDAATVAEDLRSMDRSRASAADPQVLDRTTLHERPERTGWAEHTRLYPASPTLPGQHRSGETAGSGRQRRRPSRGVGTVLAWATALVLLMSVGSLAVVALDGKLGLLSGSPQPTDVDRTPPRGEAPTQAGQQEQTPPSAPVSPVVAPEEEPTTPTPTPAPGTVDSTDVEEAAGDYYRAAGVENWAYTYENLDSGTESMFTEEEWFEKNQWFADNAPAIYHVDSVRLDGSSPEPVAEVDVRLTGGDGASSTRTTYFVYEDGSWQHRFGQEEIDLFIPGTPYEEFVAAR